MSSESIKTAVLYLKNSFKNKNNDLNHQKIHIRVLSAKLSS